MKKEIKQTKKKLIVLYMKNAYKHKKLPIPSWKGAESQQRPKTKHNGFLIHIDTFLLMHNKKSCSSVGRVPA